MDENGFGNSYINLQKFKGDTEFDNSIRSQIENGNIETNKENSMNSESKNYSYKLTPSGQRYYYSKNELKTTSRSYKLLFILAFLNLGDLSVDILDTIVNKEIVSTSTLKTEVSDLDNEKDLKKLELHYEIGDSIVIIHNGEIVDVFRSN